MYCKKCGTKLNEGDSFCLSCGTKVAEENTGAEIGGAGQGLSGQGYGQRAQQSTPSYDYQAPKQGLSTPVIRFIIANAVMFVTYFLGWLKVKGDAEEIFEYFGVSDMNSFSPRLIFKGFTLVKDYGTDIPPAGNLFYLLIVIPVAAGLAILFALLKKNGLAKLCTIVGGIITILFAIGALLLTLTGEIGVKLGVFIAIIAAIYSFIAAGGLKLDSNR
jgi:hypothetical protein